MNVANPATEWLRCNIPQQGRARTFGRPKTRGRRVLTTRQPAPLLRSDWHEISGSYARSGVLGSGSRFGSIVLRRPFRARAARDGAAACEAGSVVAMEAWSMMLFPRKVVIYLAATVAAAVALVSGHPAAAQIIKGPDTAAVNQEVRLVVEDLKTPELAKASEWAQKLKLDVSSPTGAQWLADPELTIGLGSGGLKVRVYFSADKPGIYVLVLLDGNSGGLALHRITVGGQAPVVPPVNPTTPGPVDPNQPAPGPSKVTQVTLVYEQRGNPLNPQVLSALNTLNRQGVLSTTFDQDTTDGTGDTPEQYKAALAAAKQAGLPCLVVQAGKSVVRVISNPTTSEHVLEAVR